MIHLKDSDKKLLAYLYTDARKTASAISKEIKLSREQIIYRIKKFESEGVIKGYLPLIKYAQLNYRCMTLVLFKCRKQTDILSVKEELKSSKNRLTTVETLNKYDLVALFIFKDEKERNNYILDMLDNNSSRIKEYVLLEPYFSEFYPLKFLNDKRTTSQIFKEYEDKSYVLDPKEKKILKVLNKNARAQIIDIAKETNLSAELVVYKLKRLKEEGVLLSARAYFDMKKIGYFYSLILINFKNFSKQNKSKMRNFARENKIVDSLMFLIVNPNCYVQVFYKEQRELIDFLEAIRDHFKEEEMQIEVISLKNEGEDIQTLPFLE